MSTEAVDYIVFHAPYNKLVQKSIARMVLLSSFPIHFSSILFPLTDPYFISFSFFLLT